MKNLFYLLITLLISTHMVNSQNLTLEWAEPNTNSFSSSDLDICGATKEVRLKASYSNDQQCPYNGWGANRYRFTIKLYKNNVLISTRIYPASSCWINDTYSNFNLSEGHYRANIMLEVRGAFWRWRVQNSGYTSSFIVRRNSATPIFTINGIVPDPKIPIEVCPSKIIIDPSNTSCEDKYWVGVWEFDYQNWNRPREYEWGKWFDGEASSNLNLQQLSAQYSFNSDFLGTDISREGEILYGGNLPNNNPRYYYISICTGFPDWQCASAIIKVKCDCP